jgi:hypothetical protein
MEARKTGPHRITQHGPRAMDAPNSYQSLCSIAWTADAVRVRMWRDTLEPPKAPTLHHVGHQAR